jgi:hypothetical protein
MTTINKYFIFAKSPLKQTKFPRMQAIKKRCPNKQNEPLAARANQTRVSQL